MIQAIIYFGAVIGASVGGGLAPLFFFVPSKSQFSFGLLFSAGILLGASFLHLIPEAYEHMGEHASFGILFGFLLIFLMEKFMLAHPCEENDCAVHQIGIPAFVGISLHSLADGLALGAGFFLPKVGWIVLLGLIFHKIPAAFSLSTILMAAQYQRSKIIKLIIIFSLTTPLGAAVAILGLRGLGETFLGLGLAVSAGTFLAIATSDLFIKIHSKEQDRVSTLFAMFAGVIVAVVGKMVLHLS